MIREDAKRRRRRLGAGFCLMAVAGACLAAASSTVWTLPLVIGVLLMFLVGGEIWARP